MTHLVLPQSVGRRVARHAQMAALLAHAPAARLRPSAALGSFECGRWQVLAGAARDRQRALEVGQRLVEPAGVQVREPLREDRRGDAQRLLRLDAVATQLLSSGITPVEILEGQEGSQWVRNYLQKMRGSKPTLSELILFSRQMYSLMKAGVPITRGIGGLVESTRNLRFAENPENPGKSRKKCKNI